MTPLRIGLVGVGSAGFQHAQALKLLRGHHAVLSAVVARTDPLQGLLHKLDILPVPRFDALADMLAAKVCDAVILATPDGAHRDQAIQCFASGHHVLVEKPLALSRADGLQILDAADQASCVLTCGYHLRHHAGHRVLRQNLESYIGRLRSIFIHWAWPDPSTSGWRASGQAARHWAMSALGTHCADLALWFAGGFPTHAASLLRQGSRSSLDLGAEVTVRFDSGVDAHLSVAVDYRSQSKLLLVGDLGSLECLKTLGSHGGGSIWITLQHYQGRIPYSSECPYAAQLRSFAREVAERDPSRQTSERLRQLANLWILDEVHP